MTIHLALLLPPNAAGVVSHVGLLCARRRRRAPHALDFPAGHAGGRAFVARALLAAGWECTKEDGGAGGDAAEGDAGKVGRGFV